MTTTVTAVEGVEFGQIPERTAATESDGPHW